MKKLIISLILLFFWWIVSGVVYANINKYDNIKLTYKSLSFVDLNYKWLDELIVWYNSDFDISDLDLSSPCDANIDFLSKKEKTYFFKITFNDKSCKIWNFYLRNKEWDITNTNLRAQIISSSQYYKFLVDYDTTVLEKILEKLNSQDLESKEIDYKNLDIDKLKENNNKIKLIYLKDIIGHIIDWRKEKYLIPVAWESLPTRRDKLPNGPRPYRANYTTGIHEWWDIDWDYGTPIIAMDDWVVVKVVNDFVFEDLDNIVYDDVSDLQKRINLDILRWNQVWLKTLKWDVIFYGHLSEVNDKVYVWDFIKKWTEIGKMWSSWVPDENYTDYHLHFEVREAPKNKSKAWKYTLNDYMYWDWYFKWETQDYIKENQYNIFK